MKEDAITEYHLCSQCEHSLSVPTDPDFRSFELCCRRKSSQINPEGGLTNCTQFQEK